MIFRPNEELQCFVNSFSAEGKPDDATCISEENQARCQLRSNEAIGRFSFWFPHRANRCRASRWDVSSGTALAIIRGHL
jgi:hypothetical protein